MHGWAWSESIEVACRESQGRNGVNVRKEGQLWRLVTLCWEEIVTAWMGVSSTEKTVTNTDLTRVTVKTWSQMQTVIMGHVGLMDGSQVMI